MTGFCFRCVEIECFQPAQILAQMVSVSSAEVSEPTEAAGELWVVYYGESGSHSSPGAADFH